MNLLTKDLGNQQISILKKLSLIQLLLKTLKQANQHSRYFSGKLLSSQVKNSKCNKKSKALENN